jgi:hypothetical protein
VEVPVHRTFSSRRGHNVLEQYSRGVLLNTAKAALLLGLLALYWTTLVPHTRHFAGTHGTFFGALFLVVLGCTFLAAHSMFKRSPWLAVITGASLGYVAGLLAYILTWVITEPARVTGLVRTPPVDVILVLLAVPLAWPGWLIGAFGGLFVSLSARAQRQS